MQLTTSTMTRLSPTRWYVWTLFLGAALSSAAGEEQVGSPNVDLAAARRMYESADPEGDVVRGLGHMLHAAVCSGSTSGAESGPGIVAITRMLAFSHRTPRVARPAVVLDAELGRIAGACSEWGDYVGLVRAVAGVRSRAVAGSLVALLDRPAVARHVHLMALESLASWCPLRAIPALVHHSKSGWNFVRNDSGGVGAQTGTGAVVFPVREAVLRCLTCLGLSVQEKRDDLGDSAGRVGKEIRGGLRIEVARAAVLDLLARSVRSRDKVTVDDAVDVARQLAWPEVAEWAASLLKDQSLSAEARLQLQSLPK